MMWLCISTFLKPLEGSIFVKPVTFLTAAVIHNIICANCGPPMVWVNSTLASNWTLEYNGKIVTLVPRLLKTLVYFIFIITRTVKKWLQHIEPYQHFLSNTSDSNHWQLTDIRAISLHLLFWPCPLSYSLSLLSISISGILILWHIQQGTPWTEQKHRINYVEKNT